MLTEFVIVLLLILLNGIFAGAEIAVLTVRRTRMAELAARGHKSARSVLRLREHPERFLATVQIGITVVGATAAAYGGASVARDLAPLLARIEWLAPYAQDVALVLVIVVVAFLSLVLGELVPKSLALRYGEGYARVVGRGLEGLAWLARPLVWFLTASSNLVLRPFGDRTTFTEAHVSSKELQRLVQEAAETGAVDRETSKIASRALEFGELTASDVMIPRNRIDAIPRSAGPDDVKRRMLESGHSRMPIYEGGLDNVVGYVVASDVLAMVWEKDVVILEDLIRPPYFVPETVSALQLMHELRHRQAWMAFVVDEHGALAGLVTMEDLIEELVGEIFNEAEIPEQLITEEDGGTLLVRGHASLRDLNRGFGLALPEGEGFTTMAGLCAKEAGYIPQKGTRLPLRDGTRLEVLDALPRMVRLVRLTRPPSSEATSAAAERAD